MEPWLSNILLIITVLVFVGGMIPVWRYIWQQRKNRSQPPEYRHAQRSKRQTIHMKTRENQGVVFAEAPSPQSPQARARLPQGDQSPWFHRLRLPKLQKPSWLHMPRLHMPGRPSWLHMPGRPSWLRRSETPPEAPHRHEQRQPATAPPEEREHGSFWGWLREQMALTISPLQTLVVVLVVAALLGVGFLFAPDIRAYLAADQFVVVVAPFDDGSSGQNATGAAVARDLTHVLQEQAGDRFIVRSAEVAPATRQEALELADEHGSDVLVWGAVEPGGLANDASLQPQLTYTPNGAYAPAAWDGYSGRFTLEGTYTLANQPINGAVVLPDLLQAIADYGAGNTDMARIRLQDVLQDYPELHPSLLRALLGNMYWASGRYDEAAREYRSALDLRPHEQAQLTNNLAAILLDDNDNEAQSRLLETAGMLNGGDMGELRYNIGLAALREGRPNDAIVAFEQARNLLSPEASLLLALSEAYRDVGDLARAEAALNAADVQIDSDVGQVPPRLRTVVYERLHARVLGQRGVLALSRMADARGGPLVWELEVSPPLSHDQLREVIDTLQESMQASDNLAQAWRDIGAQSDAASELANYPVAAETSPVAAGQAQLALDLYAQQHYYYALALIEDGRSQEMRERGWLMRIWDAVGGVGEPIDTAQNELAALREASSEDVWLRNAQARSLRLQELLEPDRPNEETIDAAHALYNQIIADAPTRPEGYYGNGTLSLLLGDREGARQWMQQALAQNGRFFPARLQLIAFAEEDQNWLGAVEHLEVLAEQYPARSERMYLTAASLLRRSGPANFARAQQLLGTLIDNEATSRPTRVAALVERGRLYRDMNETDLAIQVLERAQNLDDDSARAAFELGQIFAQQRNFEQAEEQFLTATNGDNGIIRAQAHLAIAELYASEEALNQPDDARDHFEQALDAGVDDPDALIRIGDSLRRFDRISSAAEAFLRADTLQESADPLAALRLAQVYLDLGELEDARTYAQRARELARDAPDILADALVVLGDVQRLSGDFVSAVNLYNQALEANVNQMHAALGLGFVAIGRDQWPVALSHFKNAVEMPTSEDRVLAHFWYAEALLRLGRLAEARQQYAHALALEPEMPEALLGLAQLAYRRNNLQEAEQFLEAALDQREEYAEALLFKGRLLYEQDQFDAALDALNRSIAANEEIGEAYYRRALVLMVEHENVERALDDLQRAVQLDPSDEESFYWLGRAYLVDQDYEEALQAFQEAIRLRGGNYAEARFYQGLAEEALDLIEQARNSFDAVIQTASDSELVEMANTALQRITP